MYVINSCFQLFTCMFFNFTAARDESSSDSDRDVPEEFEPPPPPPGQGRPTKPSHDRQAKGGGGHPRSTTSQRAESSISECKFFSSKLLSMYSSV